MTRTIIDPARNDASVLVLAHRHAQRPAIRT